MASLNGKVIALTGAASGMGKATAKILYERGASLALCDISEAAVHEVARNLSQNGTQKVTSAKVDVRSTAEVNAWTESILKDFGRLDGAGNIAGVINQLSPFVDSSDEDWEWIMGVNTSGVYKCMRAQLKLMNEHGSIVNVASIAGLTGMPGSVAYCASKHAVIGLTRCGAKEGGERRIRVNAIAPGTIDTPMLASAPKDSPVGGENLEKNVKLQVPLQRVGKPEEIGRLIAYLLSDDASYVNGDVVRIDGGWTG